MKTILAIAFILASSAVAAEDLVATLRSELAALNLAAPEADAERDISNGQAACFSVNSYARYFPGVSREDQEYCEKREKNFTGTWDVVLSKEHGELISQATKYAKSYNTYVLSHRK